MAWSNPFKKKPKEVPVVYNPKKGTLPYSEGTTPNTSDSSSSYGSPITSTPSGTPQQAINNASRSSSGGRSSNRTPIYNDSGNLTGIDTGEQSVVPSEVDKIIYPSRNALANRNIQDQAKPKVVDSYKDVTIIEQSNSQGQVEKVSIADSSGKTIRELRSGESVRYSPKYYEVQEAKPVSTYTARPEPKGVLNKAQDYITREQYKRDSLVLGVAGNVVGTAQVIKTVFTTNPVTTTKNLFFGGKEVLRKVGGEGFPEIGQTLYNEPRYSTGFVAGEIATGYGIGAVARTTLKVIPKLRTLEIPTEAGKINVNILGYETKGGRSFTIGARTPDRISIGKPEIRPYLNVLSPTSEIKIGSALETATLRKALKDIPSSTERAKELISTSQNILRSTANTKSSFINKEFLTSATERLPREGVNVFLDIAKSERGVLFGSKSRAFQLAQEYNINGQKFKLNKVPRDVELRFDNLGEEGLKSVTEKSIQQLKKLGTIKQEGKVFELGTSREIADTPFAIESRINGKFIKVAELKGKSLSPLSGEEVPEFVVGIKKTGKPMKINGIEATPLREELRGVTQGVLRVRKSKETGLLDIFPSPKREKDIGSVVVSSRSLAMSKIFPSRLNKNIEKFESYFPEELVREQLLKVNEADKVVLADFTRPVKTNSVFSNSNLVRGSVINYLPSPNAKAEMRSEISNLSKVISEVSLSPLIKKSVSPKVISSSPNRSPKSPSPRSSPSVSNVFSESPTSPSPVFPLSPSPNISPSPKSKSPSPRSPISPSPNPSPVNKSPSPKKVFDNYSSSPIKKLINKIKQNEDIYEVFGKRFGKDFSLGKYKSKKEAEQKTFRFLQDTLGASAKLTKNNAPLKFTDLDLSRSKQFISGKKDPFKVVQVNKFRLTRGDQQVREINYFKKKKSKKTNKFNW